MRPFDPRLLAHAKSARRHIVTAAAIGIAAAVLVIAQATVLGTALAQTFTGQPTGLAAAAMALAAIGTARAALSWASEVAAHRASATVKSELRAAAVARIADLGPTWVSRERSAEVATTLVRGLDALDPYFARYVPSLILAATVPIAGGAWILHNDPLSAAIVAVTVPLVPFFMVLVGRFTQSEVARQWRSLQTLAGHFLDLVTGVTTLKAFNRSAGQVTALRASGEDYRVATMRVLRVSFLSALVLELISTVAVALVAVSIGLRLDAGRFGLREGLIILILVPEVYLPLRNVGAHFHAAAEGMEAVDRVLAIIETPLPVVHDGTRNVVDAIHVEFRDVSFSYPGATGTAIAGFSATFEAGRLSVLSGPSGCGKTTALSLLMRFAEPSRGAVLVDGVDVRGLSTESLRAAISYLPQTPWLPHGTVRQALCATGPVPDERLVAVCEHAGLSMSELPAGLDTALSRRAGISAGQRRRLALARMLLAPGRIVLLDEPTASVDAASEAAIIEVVRRLADEGRVVVMVSHRAAALAAADCTVSLDLPQGVVA